MQLYVPTKPVPQARPRGRVQGVRKVSEGMWAGKPWVQIYEEAASSNYQDFVAATVRQQILSAPVVEVGSGGDFKLPFYDVRAMVNLRFNIEKPKSYPARVTMPTKKPDVDNSAKSVIDGMVKGLLLKDDSLITDLFVIKRYADDDHPQGVEIDMTVMPVEVP